jgi:mono/diheme cytochrome c family protein
MRFASLILLLLPLAAAAQDSGRGRLLYETHCGTCHYERVHQRIKSDVKDLADLRDTVARWASQTRHNFTLDELEEVVAYLNESHYRFGLPPGSRRELIYGAELMSEHELDDYRAQLAGAPSDQAQSRIRAQHRERIRERAKVRGVQIAEPLGTVRR